MYHDFKILERRSQFSLQDNMNTLTSRCYRDIKIQNFVNETLCKLTTIRNVNENQIFHAFLMRIIILDDKTISQLSKFRFK
jgi:hypothetical protein